MIIIPAIDIKDGKCVRLTQGDFNQQKIYGDDPVEMALKWERGGAKMIHLVDLDGARDGEQKNFEVIEQIRAVIKGGLEVGGGIRDIKTLEKYLNAGIDQVVLGTLALENEALLLEIVNKYPQKIAIGLDARDGKLTTRGWLQQTDMDVLEAARKFAVLGVRRIIYTDILKDGTLTEPNFAVLKEMVAQVKCQIIASGGISSVEQIRQLKAMGVSAVILGKSIYEGTIDLKEALNVG